MADREQPAFSIRPAGADDVVLILDLIKELADYEKLLHQVQTSEADLHAALFGEQSVAEALVGEYREEAVAFALFFHTFSTFAGRPGLYLEDLYVKSAYRGRGFGRQMLAHLANIARARHCGRFEWSVLNWNEPAIKTYRGIGAVPMDEWTLYRLTGDDLARLADKAV